MIKVLISGALGKMGKKVYSALLNSNDATPVCGIDRLECFDNPDFPVYDGFDKVKEKVDVIIDFSSPLALNGILTYIKNTNTPAVLCATGYSDKDISAVKEVSEKVAIFRSANMSLGVNVLISAVKEVAKSLYGFDIEIVEKHHNQKKDAPSGTAVMISDAIKSVYPEKYEVYGRQGLVGARNKDEIGMHSIRGGNIVGDHEVIFAGNNEVITLSHSAFDRAVFADGAVKAAVFISNKKNGLYDMSDMLNKG